MIVKVKSHKRPSFKNLLNYLVHNNDRLYDAKGRSMLVTHNIKGNNVEDWDKQYKQNENFRFRKRIDSVYCTHEILSWHKNDSSKVTPKKLEAIARAYIKMRNPNGIYVAVPHFDKEHYHLHICTSGIEYRTGKSMRMSKQAFAKLKLEIQNYQIEQFPELDKSQVKHGRKIAGKEVEHSVSSIREKDKAKLQAILKTCFKRAKSVKEFNSLLKESKSELYYRSGRLTGVVFNDRKYRFNRIGFPSKKINYLETAGNRQNELLKLRKNVKLNKEFGR